MRDERLFMKWWFWVCVVFLLLIVILGVCWLVTAIKGEYTLKVEMNEYMKDAVVSYASTYNQTQERCPTVQNSVIQKDWCKSGYTLDEVKESPDGMFTYIMCRKVNLPQGVKVIA